jgi:hypothetical protein
VLLNTLYVKNKITSPKDKIIYSADKDCSIS